MNCLINDLAVEKLKIVLFFSPDTTFKAIRVANAVSEEFGDFFKEDPNIITLPPNAPAEIPRLIYNQENVNFTIGTLRSDLSITLKNRDSSWKEIVKNFSRKLNELFIEKLRLRIIRIGIVVNYSFNEDCSLEVFLKQYINSNRLDNVSEYNMSWLNKLQLEGICVNKWTRLFISDKTLGKRNLLIDINTVMEQALDLSVIHLHEVIDLFLEYLEGEISNVL